MYFDNFDGLRRDSVLAYKASTSRRQHEHPPSKAFFSTLVYTTPLLSYTQLDMRFSFFVSASAAILLAAAAPTEDVVGIPQGHVQSTLY